jgi:beta-xylosidase
MVCSKFKNLLGIIVLHSTDLIRWRTIGHVMIATSIWPSADAGFMSWLLTALALLG